MVIAPGRLGLRALAGRRLLRDPREVVRVAPVDGPGRYTGNLVGVFPPCASDDFGYSRPAGVQRCPAFGALVDLAAPPVGRLDWVEVMHARAEPVLDEL